MLILSILIWFLVTNLGGAREVVEAGLTRSRLAEIEAMLSAWADERGDFPSSSFTPEQGVAPNLANLGSECLYLALCAAGQDGVGKLDEKLANVDGDRLARRLEGFESLELYEIGDDWQNPIAYLHHRDYGRRDLYQSLDPETGELLEAQVTGAEERRHRALPQPAHLPAALRRARRALRDRRRHRQLQGLTRATACCPHHHGSERGTPDSGAPRGPDAGRAPDGHGP